MTTQLHHRRWAAAALALPLALVSLDHALASHDGTPGSANWPMFRGNPA